MSGDAVSEPEITIPESVIREYRLRTSISYFLRWKSPVQVLMSGLLAHGCGVLPTSLSAATVVVWIGVVATGTLAMMGPAMLVIFAAPGRIQFPQSLFLRRLMLGSLSLLVLPQVVLTGTLGIDEGSYIGYLLKALGLGLLVWFGGHLLDAALDATQSAWRHTRAAVAGTSADGAISLPPCSGARAVLAFLLPAKIMSSVYDPVIADTQAEWFEAAAAGRRGHAHWIRFRGLALLCKVLIVHGVVGLVRTGVDIFKMMKG